MTEGDLLLETAAICRRLLAKVESGEVRVAGERDIALLRRIEGAAGALEETTKRTGALRAQRREGGSSATARGT